MATGQLYLQTSWTALWSGCSILDLALGLHAEPLTDAPARFPTAPRHTKKIPDPAILHNTLKNCLFMKNWSNSDSLIKWSFLSGLVKGWEWVCWGVLGAPCLNFVGFRDSSRFHHRKIMFFWENTWEKPIGLDPRKVQTYSNTFNSFSRICLL